MYVGPVSMIQTLPVPSLRMIEGLELSGFVLWSDLQNLDNLLRCPLTRQKHGVAAPSPWRLVTVQTPRRIRPD
jgi:hypothetical protein